MKKERCKACEARDRISKGLAEEVDRLAKELDQLRKMAEKLVVKRENKRAA